MVLCLLIGFTEALAVEEIKKDNIGPWEIEATFKDNKFDHCAISGEVDEVVASFLRTSDGLSLTLEFPDWKLERGKNYPVRMKAGAASWNTDVAAETNCVSVPLSDTKFKDFVQPMHLSSRVPEQQSEFLWIEVVRHSTGWISLTKNSRAMEVNRICCATSATVTSATVRFGGHEQTSRRRRASCPY